MVNDERETDCRKLLCRSSFIIHRSSFMNRSNMNTLGVILARAGSVGLASKHLRLLLGRPMIEYTFDHAFDSALLTRVVVSTDCPGVKKLAARHGLEVIDHPAELATSVASSPNPLLTQ